MVTGVDWSRRAVTAFSSRARRIVLLSLAAAVVASMAAAQFQGRRGGGRFGPRVGPNPPYDGAFQFCRIIFRNASDGDGGGWYVDWPRADQNLSFRFSELTRTTVSRDVAGNFNHITIALTDEQKKVMRQTALDNLIEDALMRQYLSKHVPQVSQTELVDGIANSPLQPRPSMRAAFWSS